MVSKLYMKLLEYYQNVNKKYFILLIQLSDLYFIL